MAVFWLPVVLRKSVIAPLAVFWMPVVLLVRALCPVAVLKPPVVLLERAAIPIAVLKLPVVLLERAALPIAVLLRPVLLTSASIPRALLVASVRTLGLRGPGGPGEPVAPVAPSSPSAPAAPFAPGGPTAPMVTSIAPSPASPPPVSTSSRYVPGAMATGRSATMSVGVGVPTRVSVSITPRSKPIRTCGVVPKFLPSMAMRGIAGSVRSATAFVTSVAGEFPPPGWPLGEHRGGGKDERRHDDG